MSEKVVSLDAYRKGYRLYSLRPWGDDESPTIIDFETARGKLERGGINFFPKTNPEGETVFVRSTEHHSGFSVGLSGKPLPSSPDFPDGAA